MKKEQRIPLEPLSSQSAMCLLWSIVNSISNEDADDAKVEYELINLKTSNSSEYQAIEKLCCHLGCLPLALVQAGSYIRHFECRFKEYVETYESSSKQEKLDTLLRKSNEFDPVRPEQRAVLTTWKMSVELLSPRAFEVLRTISLLGNILLPEFILKAILEKISKSDDSVVCSFRHVVIDELVYGSYLLQWRKADSSFDMYHLVRQFLILELQNNNKETWSTFSNILLLTMHECVHSHLRKLGFSFIAFPEEPNDRLVLYLEHVLSVVHLFTQDIGSRSSFHYISQLHDILKYAVTSLSSLGRANEENTVALNHVKILRSYELKNVDTSERKSGLRSIDLAHALGMLGSSYLRVGKVSDAEAAIQECYEIQVAIHGSNTPEHGIAKSLQYLGLIAKILGKLVTAEALLHKMQEEVYGAGAENPDLAITYGHLAAVYESRGEFAAAEEMLLKSLKMNFAVLGEDSNHPNIAETFMRLGGIYGWQGKHEKAELTQRKALRMIKINFGNDSSHPQIISILISLSAVLGLQEKTG